MNYKKAVESYSDQLARLFPKECSINRSAAKTVTFQVTDACNLCCTYCYQTHKGRHTMPFEVAKCFIDILLRDEEEYINTRNSAGLIIDFIGGEPLLEIDLIDQITDYLISQMIEKQHPWATRFAISICSNGLLYFEPKVQEYLNKHRRHLSFSITIDGNKELHDSCRIQPDGSGSYDIAMAAVKDWVSKGNYMGSKITLAPENIEFTYDAIKSIIKNGYDDININCVFEEGWGKKHATTLYYQLKKVADYLIDNDLVETHRVAMFDEECFGPLSLLDNQNWCGGTGAMTAVDWKGDIYPCLRYMESSLGSKQPPMIIGNVWDGFMKKECEKDCVNCLKSITRHSQSTDECFYCPIAKGCAWCSAYNYQVFGTANKRATFICIMHKARALANVYFWNKWYQKTSQNKIFENNMPENWALEIINKEELDYLNNLIKKGEQ